jgi:hypothetical protein
MIRITPSKIACVLPPVLCSSDCIVGNSEAGNKLVSGEESPVTRPQPLCGPESIYNCRCRDGGESARPLGDDGVRQFAGLDAMQHCNLKSASRDRRDQTIGVASQSASQLRAILEAIPRTALVTSAFGSCSHSSRQQFRFRNCVCDSVAIPHFEMINTQIQ